MTAVLGTPIEAAAPSDAVLLISDLHLAADGGAALGLLRGALAAARAGGAAVYILGDLFDSYVSARQIGHGIWCEVAAALRAAAPAVRVAVLCGNRDFLLGPEFVAAARVRLIAGGVRGSFGGVDTLLLHGDELCQNDLPYQRAKRWLRNPAIRFVARRLPVRVALAVAARARRRSVAVVRGGDPQRFTPTAAAADAAFGLGVARLAFGHIHRHSFGRCAAGEYRVLPAFDEQGGGVFIDRRGWRPVRILDSAGSMATVAEPEPLAWA